MRQNKSKKLVTYILTLALLSGSFSMPFSAYAEEVSSTSNVVDEEKGYTVKQETGEQNSKNDEEDPGQKNKPPESTEHEKSKGSIAKEEAKPVEEENKNESIKREQEAKEKTETKPTPNENKEQENSQKSSLTTKQSFRYTVEAQNEEIIIIEGSFAEGADPIVEKSEAEELFDDNLEVLTAYQIKFDKKNDSPQYPINITLKGGTVKSAEKDKHNIQIWIIEGNHVKEEITKYKIENDRIEFEINRETFFAVTVKKDMEDKPEEKAVTQKEQSEDNGRENESTENPAEEKRIEDLEIQIDADINNEAVKANVNDERFVATILEGTNTPENKDNTQYTGGKLEGGDNENYKISVEYDANAQIPQNSTLSVSEINGTAYIQHLNEAEKIINAPEIQKAYVLDISILNEAGESIEPEADVNVSIELLKEENQEAFSVVHFGDTTEELPSEVVGDAITFTTSGFSAYAIVQAPDPTEVGAKRITTIEDFINHGATGVYIGHTAGYYFTNGTTRISASRTGITKTKPASEKPTTNAALYYFERADENRFYAYCYNGETKQYVQNLGNNSLSFTDEANKTAFTVSVDDKGQFTINNGAWYWNMQGGVGGASFASYNNAGDPNNKLYMWVQNDTEEDPYGLDQKTYGLISWNGGVAGKALMAESSAPNTLDAIYLTVMSKSDDNGNKLFVPNSADISMWKFNWVSDDIYTITTICDGSTKYLKIGNSGPELVSQPDDLCNIQVIPGTGAHAGEICLRSGNNIITYSGNINTGFRVSGSAGSEWLYLVSTAELTADYLMTYSAKKVSVSDAGITNGSRVVVYTRAWNDTKKKYEFYAINHDGTLVPCYESSESIQWVGTRINTLLWNFVEYQDDGVPNYYYELFNPYSEKFIAPNATDGTILSDIPVGINLNGRRNGYYYSSILAWDNHDYAYKGLKVSGDRIVTCPIGEADDFYFAIMDEQETDDSLTEVETIDNTKHGIKMKLIDFRTRAEMSNFLGNDEGGAVMVTQPSLLSTYLDDDGYPTAKGGSLSTWFNNAREVNHLFIGSSYSGSGYYEFDSTQNFASLQPDNNFKVYKEIGSYDSGGDKNTLKHGQFFPFNDIEPGVFGSVNSKNLYNAKGEPLADGDPRKYEQLYLIKNVNTQFGMEIEAQFTQTPNGLDAWGHDIIYEFTGDDDFWLYVDGELVIDLGGIHSALPGSINYSTGEVNVNGYDTTLYDIFREHYTTSNPSASEAEINAYLEEKFEQNERGEWIFKDYTTHTMKIFFLERGGGASNINMHFNLSSVKPGTFELSKKLSGVEDPESFMAEFPFQIWYKLPGENETETEHLLTQNNNDQIRVVYKDTIRGVTFKPSITEGDVAYQNVFLLKPGETAEIQVPDNTISYKVIECGVNTDVYNEVKINGTETQGIERSSNRKDYEIDYETTRNRAKVEYVNQVDSESLRTLTITKKLYDESGTTELLNDQTTFDLRLYLGSENDNTIPAVNMQTYHVKDRDGNYCRWNTRKFESIGIRNYSDLTPEQKKQVSFTTSMNGSISKIPAFYTVEIREIMIGTRFKVLERSDEIPDGYSLQKYVYYEDQQTDGTDSQDPIQGTVTKGKDPHIDVCNLRGWGLRVNKQWSDADYVTEHRDVYFAIYTGPGEDELSLLPESIRKMSNSQNSLYWYFQSLPVSLPFEQYEVREVEVTNPVVNSEDIVTAYDSITKLADNDKTLIEAKQKGENTYSENRYTVLYEKGEMEESSNVRVDTVTNYRPGVVIRKKGWSNEPIAGAVFTITDAQDNQIGTFTSDANGDVTVAYLSENTDYTLKEIQTPSEYRGIDDEIHVQLHNENITVSGTNEENYTLAQESGKFPTLTILNRPRTFRVVKVDGTNDSPIQDVHFALHRQVTIGNVTSIDFNPMPGYEDLVTDENGVLEKVNTILPTGTYELREKNAPEEYQKMFSNILFSVSPTGKIQILNTTKEAAVTEEIQNDNSVVYTMSIKNYKKVVVPTGYESKNKPYVVMLITALVLACLLLRRKAPT